MRLPNYRTWEFTFDDGLRVVESAPRDDFNRLYTFVKQSHPHNAIVSVRELVHPGTNGA